MTPHASLSAALHFDFDLASDPQPFERVVATLTRTSPTEELLSWIIDLKNYAPPPEPLDLDRVVARIASETLSVAAVESALKTAELSRLSIVADVVPRGERSRSQTRCRHDFKAVCGAQRLHESGSGPILDALISFADAVGVRAGAVFWAHSAAYASCLASCSESSALSREESSHVSDLMYWQPRWGDVIRGPQWGTFLGAPHVLRLGGIARIESESGCSRIVPLASGGAFLQTTSIENAFVEGDDRGVLAKLARYLTPVMGTR